MMKIFSFFLKKPYKFLGRGGIQFTKGDLRFNIDTNNFIGKNNSVEIFYNDIKCINADIDLSLSEKKDIAYELKEALQKNGIDSVVL